MKLPGWMVFVKEGLSNPFYIGAFCPSSKHLGREMCREAKQALEKTPGLVVELGAGTGAVTVELLRGGIPPEQLRVVERSPTLVNHLRERFPSVQIIEGDAQELQNLIQNETLPVTVVVSSLPLRGMPKALAQAIAHSCRTILAENGTFIQFTYRLFRRFGPLDNIFKKQHSHIEWLNFPPAEVSVYKNTLDKK